MILNQYLKITPVPVTAGSQVWFCGHSLAGIAGANAAERMYICLLWESMSQADHSSREVIPSVECLSVLEKSHREEA